MRFCLTLFLLLLITSCSKHEVKSYRDLIADGSLIVLKIQGEDDLKRILKPFAPYLDVGKMTFPHFDSGREAVLAITNVDDFTSYAAIPIAPESGAKVLESLPEWKRSSATVTDNYLFIALSGDLPSSWGNYKYGEELKDKPLIMSIDCDSLMNNGEEEVVRFLKSRAFFNFLNLKGELRNPFWSMIEDSGLELLKQTEKITITADRQKDVDITLSLLFKDQAELAGVSQLTGVKLPINKLEGGVKGSCSLDLSRLPHITDIISFCIKHWLADSGRSDLVLPFQMLVSELGKHPFESFFSISEGDFSSLDFVYKSKSVPAVLGKIMNVLTESKQLLNIKGVLSTVNSSVEASQVSGILKFEIDCQKEKDFYSYLEASYTNIWQNMMKLASSRINNVLVRKLISSMKAPDLLITKISLLVTVAERELTLKVKF